MGLSSTRAAGPFKSPATGEAESDFAQTPCAAAARLGSGWSRVRGLLVSCCHALSENLPPGSSEVWSKSLVAPPYLQISVSHLEILGG